MNRETEKMLPMTLAICLALQESKQENATALLPSWQEELASAAPTAQLAALKNVLSLAIRKRQQDFFKQVLTTFKDKLVALVQQEELAQESENFLHFLVYTICDRRLVGERRLGQLLVEKWMHVAPDTLLRDFWNEWSSLIARMVSRCWLGESEWLLTIMVRQLWRKQDLKLVQLVLWQLQLHLVMTSRIEGVAKTFVFYKPLFYSYLMVVDHVQPGKVAGTALEAWLQTIMRSMRDIVNQLARVQMQEQQEVYQTLGEQWLKDAHGIGTEQVGEEVPVWKRPTSPSKKLEQRIKRFLQLAVIYWSLTNPKSSKKQMQYLEDMLEPWLLTPEWKKLLKKLS